MADQPTHDSLPLNTAPQAGPGPVSSISSRPAGGKVQERRSLARRSAALVRRWARDTFNREQLVASLRSFVWVAPLSLLIWIYAEREQQVPGTSRFPILLKSADPTQVANFVSSSDQNVTATLKGPKARLDKAKEMLDPRSGGGPVVVMIDGNRPPNQYEIDILAQIQKDARLEKNGITVEEVNPRYVRVDVDALQEIELVVKPDPQLRFPTPPTFEPPVVRVTAPAAAVRAAKGELYARATLPTLAPGSHSLKAVPVTPEGLDARLQLRPPTVSATVEVGQADVMYEIASLPVFPTFIVDPATLRTHALRYDQSLPNVKVYGPPDKIEQLKNGALARPQAHFDVKDVAIGKQRVQADLKYELPEGIRLGNEAPRTITFDLVPSDAS